MSDQATLSTHILNLDAGAPAAGMQVELRSIDADGNRSSLIAQGKTNDDGRAADWPELNVGDWELTFQTGPWFRSHDSECFYPRVRIEFSIDSIRHYHVPLLLNRFGFSSYRGS